MINCMNKSWSNITTSKLSIGPKYVMLCMIKSASQTNTLDMSLKDMSREFGVPKKTVINSIKTLTEAGFLKVEKSKCSEYGNLINRYSIII